MDSLSVSLTMIDEDIDLIEELTDALDLLVNHNLYTPSREIMMDLIQRSHEYISHRKSFSYKEELPNY